MIYAFFELSARVQNVRLHIMGGVDDEEYAEECYALVDQLKIKNIIFTGRVDIVKYMEKLDFTILTSISEGQPLSVLESFEVKGTLLDGPDIMWHLCIVRAWRMQWKSCVYRSQDEEEWE